MDCLLSAPEPLVHSVLIALCDDERIQARAVRYLKELQDYAASLDATTAGQAGSDGPGSSSETRKRKAPPLPAQLCVRCKRAFTLGANSPTACLHHPGELEINEQTGFWDDHDDDCHGPRDSDESREEYPEGFVWSCCDENGTSPGCTKGYHLAVRNHQFKRLRMYDTLDRGPEMDRMFEGRVLKANEFVNESLWDQPQESPSATRDLGGWDPSDGSYDSDGTEVLSDANDEGAEPDNNAAEDA